MHSPLLPLIAVAGLAASSAFAQETASAEPLPADVAAVEEVAPKPHRLKPRRVPFAPRVPKSETASEEPRRSFWERVFGIRRKTEAPAPEVAETAEATPAPKPAARPRKTASGDAAAVSHVAKPKPAGAEAEAPAVKPESSVNEPAAKTEPKATPVPKSAAKPKANVSVAPAPTPVRKPPVAPAADADADAQEKYRYEVAKSKALEDAEVRKLKEKADGATSDDEAKKAQRAYNKALFSKMRGIDPSIKDRADRIEAAILRKLDAPE